MTCLRAGHFLYNDIRRMRITETMTVTIAKSHRHWRFRIHRQLKWLMTDSDFNGENLLECRIPTNFLSYMNAPNGLTMWDVLDASMGKINPKVQMFSEMTMTYALSQISFSELETVRIYGSPVFAVSDSYGNFSANSIADFYYCYDVCNSLVYKGQTIPGRGIKNALSHLGLNWSAKSQTAQ